MVILLLNICSAVMYTSRQDNRDRVYFQNICLHMFRHTFIEQNSKASGGRILFKPNLNGQNLNNILQLLKLTLFCMDDDKFVNFK